jgi:hypothetical protein
MADYKKAFHREDRRNLQSFEKTGITADLLKKVKNTYKRTLLC